MTFLVLMHGQRVAEDGDILIAIRKMKRLGVGATLTNDAGVLLAWASTWDMSGMFAAKDDAGAPRSWQGGWS